MASSTIVVFDFDRTLIDIDSDDWMIQQFGITEIFNQFYPTLPWNSLMDRMMMELHLQGKNIDDIQECLQKIPLDLHVISAIRIAHSHGCDLRVVSDANTFFIETVLKHHGILECFTEIISNPIHLDEEGKLRIFPYHDSTAPSHGCNLCPSNMCKGKIIEEIRVSESAKGKNRFIYLGDGKGDYCPTLKLGETDHVLPRKNYPLWNLISSNLEVVKCRVHEWSNAEELENIVVQLIEHPSSAGQLLSVDCKFETKSMASQDAVGPAISVPQ